MRTFVQLGLLAVVSLLTEGCSPSGASTPQPMEAAGASTGGSSAIVGGTGGNSNVVASGGSSASPLSTPSSSAGNANTGGASATGGRSGSTGGSASATGGATPTGGRSSTGGTSATSKTSTGGTSGSGGTGGTKATGGSQATGGTSATGGTGAGGKTSDTCASPTQGDVTFSVPSGTFKGTLSVELSTTVANAEIRYTKDGTAPTSSSTLYSGSALSLTATTRLRAQAFLQGAASGAASSAIYVARGIEATHDLPVILLDSYGSGNLPTADAQRQFVNVAYMTFEPTTSGGTVSIASQPTTVSFAAFHVRGNSSAMFPKVPYRLELRDEAGDDRDCPVLGMPAESDWAMVNPYADKTLIHNNFIYALGHDLGMAVPRVTLAEVYVNVVNEPLDADDYQGVYQITETIKNQKNRLNLKQLDATKTSATEITGGYILSFEWQITADIPLSCPSGTANPWTSLGVVDPDDIVSQQKDYLTQYLVSFNTAVHGSNIADATTGYPNYIETKSWVDQVIIHEFGRNMDAYVRSQYLYKDRDAKLNAGPLWDYDLIAGVGLKPGGMMAGTMANTATDGWQYEGNTQRMTGGGTGMGASTGTTDWFLVLLKDPTFKAQLVARWKELRGSLLSDTNIASRIDGLTQGLSNAADRNFKKWNILSQAQVNPFDTPTQATWAEQIAFMKTWLQQRAAWIDTQWK
jgi:hypothetical protein